MSTSMIAAWPRERVWQRLVTQSRGLRARCERVNPEVPGAPPERLLGHRWGCPGCGLRNDSRHLSCRSCETLRWGVCP